ncbi:MAG: protein jag [Acidimicrobiales bacterium]
MEWVEITARTVEEAREVALDKLGVDERDADIEVLEAPRPGLFGRLRGHARVRARVAPTTPRPKADRRDRRSRRGERRGDASAPSTKDAPSETDDSRPSPKATAASSRRRRRRSGGGSTTVNGERTPPTTQQPRRDQEQNAMQELPIDAQADIVAEFLQGLAGAFGASDTSTSRETVDEGLVEVRLDGGELGLLVGPKGATLQAIQELARTVVQRQGGGTQEGRLRIDVAGYRQRRKEALERFVQTTAASVIEGGVAKALEPMHAADRKIVHDTANFIDGIRTVSEGDEPNRRVVLVPDS